MNNHSSMTPAEVYHHRFVPALFGPWAEVVAQQAKLTTGAQVLDVACGTGVLANTARTLVGQSGRVVGLDANDEMLAVARRHNSEYQWDQGLAEELPYDDESFTHVVSQFGFMFFQDPVQALREMRRVLRVDGRLVVAVCDALDHSPGYSVLVELLHRLFGAKVAQSFRAPFTAGDPALLSGYCRQSGISNATVTRHDGNVEFNSIDELIATERACAWTLGGLLDDDQFATLRQEANESLLPFVQKNGNISFTMPVLIITSTKS